MSIPICQGLQAKARQPPSANGPARLARYFFHECERYLRYHSAPKKQGSRLQLRGQGVISVHTSFKESY